MNGDSVEHRITILEAAMAELARLTTDHERRLRRVELRLAYGLGCVAAALFVLEKLKLV